MAIYYNGHLQSTKGGGGSSGGGVDYSTTEQNTGLKWIDGKPIYQKSVNANINLTASWVDVLTLTDVDTVIDVSNIIYRDGERCQTPFSTGTNFAKWIVRSGVLKYSIDGSSSDTMHLDWVTIRYTKTTDTV